MAYIDLTAGALVPNGRSASGSMSAATTATAGPGPDDRLTALEWRVVAIARDDGLASLRPPDWISAALRAMFGHASRMLADGRLEALRRMAVLTWHHGYVVPSREVSAFIEAGFTPNQYEAMVTGIVATKAAPRTHRVR